MAFVSETIRVKVFTYWFVKNKIKRMAYKIPIPRGVEKHWIRRGIFSLQENKRVRANWHIVAEKYSAVYYSRNPKYKGLTRGGVYIASCGTHLYEENILLQKKNPFSLFCNRTVEDTPKGVCTQCYRLWRRENNRRDIEYKKKEKARHMTRIREKRKLLDKEE